MEFHKYACTRMFMVAIDQGVRVPHTSYLEKSNNFNSVAVDIVIKVVLLSVT